MDVRAEKRKARVVVGGSVPGRPSEAPVQLPLSTVLGSLAREAAHQEQAALPDQPRKHERRRCISHCVTCGAHFSGDSAFARHRAGSHDDGDRYCVEPMDAKNDAGVPVFVAKTAEGICALNGREEPATGVTIWALRESLDAAARFRDAA